MRRVLVIDEQREGEMIHRSWINLITHTQQAIVRSPLPFFFSSLSLYDLVNLLGLLEASKNTKKKSFGIKPNCRCPSRVESLSRQSRARWRIPPASPPRKKKLITDWKTFSPFTFVCRTTATTEEKSTWHDSSFSSRSDHCYATDGIIHRRIKHTEETPLCGQDAVGRAHLSRTPSFEFDFGALLPGKKKMTGPFFVALTVVNF